MAQHMIGSHVQFSVVDKRRSMKAGADPNSHLTLGPTVFTANAGGTTTTIVGANAAPATNTNVVREGEKFRLFNSAGVLKEETVFEITDTTVGASTTLTFTPAAAAATANGDLIKLVGTAVVSDEEDLDSRLTAISGTSYSAERLRQMTTNDKIYALMTEGGNY
jgi:hypothetical protein